MSGIPPYHRQPRRTDEADRTVYCVVTTLTTTVHTELAVNAHAAFGRWVWRHSLEGQVLCGQHVPEPFPRMEVGLETAGELHEVYVVAEPVLEARGTLLDLTDIDRLGGDPHE